MVACNRESANIYSFPFFSAMSHPVEVNNISEDINIDELSGRSKSSSINSSRESSTHSDISFVPYVDRIETQSKGPSWVNQTKTDVTIDAFWIQHGLG